MNVELFKSKLAGNVAAKAGITPKQAKEIVHCVLELPRKRIERKMNFLGLGEVILINRKVPAGVASTFVGTTEIPYEAIVQFSVGNALKKITFHDLERAKRQARRRYQWNELQEMITLGGLEGDPCTPVRRPKKTIRTVKAGLEGDPNTGLRGRGGKP